MRSQYYAHLHLPDYLTEVNAKRRQDSCGLRRVASVVRSCLQCDQRAKASVGKRPLTCRECIVCERTCVQVSCS
jgi:hypothetical protein